MPNLNKVFLMGNLTRDPELRVTPKGTPICQFSLAINRTWKNEGGEKQEEVTYVDVEAWGKQGETIAKYLTKGNPLHVEGRLRLDTWEDKNTKEKRSRMKVVLEQFVFIGTKTDAPAGARPQQDPGASPERHAPPPRNSGKPASHENLDEDVPF